MGTIASRQPNAVDSTSAARSPQAVPAPSNSTIWGHFRGGKSLARGTMDCTRSLWAARDPRRAGGPRAARWARAGSPPAPRPRAPEHELRDRAKAAKLRHKAARARVKANRLQDRSRYLFQKATTMERRADELDGIVRTPVAESLNP